MWCHCNLINTVTSQYSFFTQTVGSHGRGPLVYRDLEKLLGTKWEFIVTTQEGCYRKDHKSMSFPGNIAFCFYLEVSFMMWIMTQNYNMTFTMYVQGLSWNNVCIYTYVYVKAIECLRWGSTPPLWGILEICRCVIVSYRSYVGICIHYSILL